MSRGIRNCNPGNIRHSKVRYDGEVVPSRDDEFKEFESMSYGYRAMFVLLDSYRRRYDLDTIRKMLNRYAPSTENFTESYIRYVVRRTGIRADERLDTLSARDMIPIVAAMSEIENGAKVVMADVEMGWQMFMESQP